jgi:TonB family protein
MRLFLLPFVLIASAAMGQIPTIQDTAPPPDAAGPAAASISVLLRGADGEIFLSPRMVAAVVEAEPDIAAPVGAPREGAIGLEVTISSSGTVVSAVAGRGDEGLRQAAADGVMAAWRFRPLMVNGVPQQFQTSFVVVFRDGIGKRAAVTLGGMAGMGSQALPPGAVRVSSGVMAGLLSHSESPIYPPIALAAHVQGVVIMSAIISKTGEIENLQVITGPPMLVGAAKDAVQRWTYKPYLLNGEPTEVQTTLNVNFTIAERPKPDGDAIQ